ncbi:hypothetical protein KSP35_09885 [Aquihabitans sp. G128]|uniref:hypothetical protein n=1 Tax=Aquihabitans sp. G128 TaxID=2849779 RepID=UPI001C22DD8A|nr:hypothetical protein [Aquihabitans sp. G128]QXC63054.1 hypothetical protein KSP35_09885 [Aquihabitans sp. G128]
MRRDGRTNRWWARGFALLGLAICSILPFGALGAIDASFDSSVAVPLLRPSSLLQARPSGALRQLRSPSTRGDDLPAVLRAATAPATTGALLVALVLLALAGEPGRWVRREAARSAVRPRGPPSWR